LEVDGAMTASTTATRPLRVVQVSFHRDEADRDAETLLSAWPTLRGVAAGVARAGVDITVVQAAAARQTLRRDEVTYELVPGRPYTSALSRRLRRVARPQQMIDCVRAGLPDVVHVHGFADPFAVWHLARALPRLPVLLQDHASVPPIGLQRLVWGRALCSLGAASFTSRRQAAPFIEARILHPHLPVWEVVEGSSSFTPGDRAEARRATGLTGDPCVLWTGHLDANKDPLTALEGFRLAADELPDARLWCCFGRAPLRTQVERRIAESDVLRERVALLGARPHSEMEALFRAADLFVQMSHREGSGYSVIEALACGTPPLVTDIPPLRSIVADAGSLTPVGDAGALANAIVTWSGADRARQRRAARERFEQALSFDAIGRQLRTVYESMAASR
jgi:glycosyltransferase involved in cell wall biosynthesis